MASRQNPTQKYYRPYVPSDSESEGSESVSILPDGSIESSSPRSDSGTATPSSIQIANAPNFAQFAYQLAQALSAGPTFSTLSTQLAFGVNMIGNYANYGPYPHEQQPPPGEKRPDGKPRNSLITLQSRDRDRSIFPQPTYCTLNLPRLYTNVKSFQIAQVSLLSAFYYFRPEKENLLIELEEQGRLVYDVNNAVVTDSENRTQPIKNIIDTTIRTGTYSINGLIQELTIRLNCPPNYYDYPNGISDFNNLFQVAGDFSLNFNYPGDYFYNSLTKTYLTNPTRQQITAIYFQTQYAPASAAYTNTQVQIAYYYPVLRDAIIEQAAGTPIVPTFKWNSSYFSNFNDLFTYVCYQYTGIDDPIILELIQANRAALDQQRLLNTFRYRPINKYLVSLDTNTNKITITCPSLNASLVNLLNSKYNSFLSAQLQIENLSAQDYANATTQLAQKVGVFQDMYRFLETNLAVYMGISLGTYSKEYYLDLSNNYYLIQNGIDLLKGPGGVLLATSFSTNSISTNVIAAEQVQPPGYWPGLTGLDLPIQTVSTNMGPAGDVAFPATSNFPYSIGLENLDSTRNAIDSNSLINSDFRRRSLDIITNVNPINYTLFEFKSKFRQTLQVEVFPRPTQYRNPEYLSSIQSPYPTQQLFSSLYEYKDPATSSIAQKLLLNTEINQVPGLGTQTNTNFGSSFSTFYSLWSTPIILNVSKSATFFQFRAPTPPPSLAHPTSTPFIKYPIKLDFLTTAFVSTTASDCVAFVYHDYGAFLADVTCNRNENARHYKFSTIIPISQPSTSLTFNVYASNTYYINLRSVQLNPNSVSCWIVPSFPAGQQFTTLSTSLSTYDPSINPACNLTSYYNARLADPDYLRLPIASSLWGIDPTGNPLNTFPASVPPSIGYDIEFVSNDLTDYVPFLAENPTSNIDPQAELRCDPTNNYFMKFLSPYNTDPAIQSYFYTGSKNTILTPNVTGNYLNWSTPTSRQYKIVNWYGTHYLSETHGPNYQLTIPKAPNILPYTISTTGSPLAGYIYQNEDNELALGNGVCGFTFLPTDGVWEVERVTFKTNYLGPSDPNDQIQYLGVFLTSQISDKPTFRLALSNAIYKLDKQTVVRYSTPTSLNAGFDSLLGTYMTFLRDPTFQSPSTIIAGYTQNGKVMITDTNAYYSVVAFTDSNTFSYIRNLVGSPVPYPYAYSASSSTAFYGTQTPFSQGVVTPVLKGGITSSLLSKWGPPLGYDETTQVYEQSLPQVNSHVHYINTQNLITTEAAFFPWSTIDARTKTATRLLRPNAFCATVAGYSLIQDNSISLFSYPLENLSTPAPDDRFFAFQGVIPHDMIFPGSITSPIVRYDATAFIGFSGTDRDFKFYGLTVNSNLSSAQILVKSYAPRTGIVADLPLQPRFSTSLDILVTQVLATSNNGFFIAAQNIVNNSTIIYGTPSYSVAGAFASRTFPGNAISMGLDPNGASLFVLTYDTAQSIGASTLQRFDFADFITFNEFPEPTVITLTRDPFDVTSIPATYTKIAVSRTATNEVVYLQTADSNYNQYFYAIDKYNQTTQQLQGYVKRSIYTFTDSQSNVRPPLQLQNGYRGGMWAFFNTAPFILGNRNAAPDTAFAVKTAYQIFYPTMKIQMTRTRNTYTPVTDLAGLEYPEYAHSVLLGYKNLSSLNSDLYISTQTRLQAKWGLESNYFVNDISMKGFYFGGYIQAFPLNPYVSSLSNTYYVAMRGYSPTESFQSLVRFYLPNRYDFGYITTADLATEVPLLLGSNWYKSNAPPDPNARPEFFNPTYGNVLRLFNQQFFFTQPQFFGINDRLNYSGFPISSIGYGDFMRQYAQFYTTYQQQQQQINRINSNVFSNMNNFITCNLQYLLPSSYQNRQKFTDPVLFRVLWSTPLTTNFKKKEDEWGLGWNLGFAKTDTLFATSHQAPSFYKILDEYIFLKLNDTYNMNRLDTGAKENYRISRDPTGSVQEFNSKLLLTTFGNFANVVVQNPVNYDPLMPKIDKLTFTWTNAEGIQIDNSDCDWSMVVSITEMV